MFRQALIWICAVLAVAFFIATIAVAGADYSNAQDWPERGTRGDFWGGHVAAGMAPVANLLFVVTLLLQIQELSLQREELRATRAEMVRSTEVAARQEEHLRKQVAIADRSSILTQVMKLSDIRAELVEQREQEAGFGISGDAKQVAALKQRKASIEAKWNARITGLDSLINGALQSEVFTDDERGAFEQLIARGSR